MGRVVSLAQHQATKQMQIREAERKAQDALLQASAAIKELHRLKGEGMAAPIDLEARRIEAAINEQRAIAEHAIDRAKEEWKKLAQMQQR